MSRRAVVGLWVVPALLLTACGNEPAAPEPARASAVEAFPDLEPFLKAPFRQALERNLAEAQGTGASDRPGSAMAAAQIRQLLGMVEKQSETLGLAGNEAPRSGDETTAYLLPRLPAAQRALFMMLPDVMESLRPLWRHAPWTEPDHELARAVATYVGRLDGAPSVGFHPGAPELNQDALDDLIRFYEAAVQRPECLAAMIFTMDDGPFAGLPVDLPEELTPVGENAVSDSVTVRLYVLPGDRSAERHVLAGYREGRRLWARLVSSAPHPSVEEIGLTHVEPTRLGRYGWVVLLSVSWSGGHEMGRLYLRPDGEFLFYFLSW